MKRPGMTARNLGELIDRLATVAQDVRDVQFSRDCHGLGDRGARYQVDEAIDPG